MISPEFFSGAYVAYALAAVAAAGAVAQGVASSKAEKQNAFNAETEAEQSRLTAGAEADRAKRENQLRLGQIRTQFGSQGTTFEGSPMLAYLENVKNAELEQQDIKYSGQLKSRSKLMEAAIYKRRSDMELFGGGVRAATTLGSSLAR